MRTVETVSSALGIIVIIALVRCAFMGYIQQESGLRALNISFW